MTDLLNTPFIELCKPGIIALVCSQTKQVEILYSRSVAGQLVRIMQDLENNKYKTRVIQERSEAGTLEVKLLEFVDLSDIESSVIKDMVLRHKSTGHCEIFHSQGLILLNKAAPLNVDIKVKLFKPRITKHPQVLVLTSRRTKYFVQKAFATVSECEEYIKNHSVEDILKGTKGIGKIFKGDA